MAVVFDRFFMIENPDLYETYVHSHVSTFMETYKNKPGFEDNKLQQALQKVVSPNSTLYRTLFKWKKDMLNIENKFFENYKKIKDLKAEFTKQDFINLLDENFKNGEQNAVISNFSALRVAILDKRFKKEKNDKEDKTLQPYRDHVVKTVEQINSFVKANTKYLATLNATDATQYEKSKKKLEDFKLDKPIEEYTRKDLNQFYEKIISNLSDLGWLFEPIVSNLIEDTIKTSIVGSNKKVSDKNVSDLIIENIKKEKYAVGINIKSAEKEYKISRVVDGDLGKYFNKEEMNQIQYIRRNLGMLKSYHINYEEYDLSEFRKLFNKYNALEEKFAFLENIISALDGVENKNDPSAKSIYSILIAYQGGFIWTSTVIDIILNGLLDYVNTKARRNRFESMGIIQATFEHYNSSEDKDMLRKLFKEKKRIIKESKKNGENVEDFYEVFPKSIFPKTSNKSMISSINYIVNLANAKKPGGNK